MTKTAHFVSRCGVWLTRKTAPVGLAAIALCAACDDEGGAAKGPSRVVAVNAARPQGADAELCDVLKTPETGAPFAFPVVEGTPKASSGWRWVNLWATWCPPCIEELPLIKRMQRELSAQGKALDLTLLSVDTSREVVERFAQTHADAQGSLRVLEPAALEAWLVSLGLDAGATLPVHIFVDPQGKVRCARTGAIRESDVPTITRLVSGS